MHAAHVATLANRHTHGCYNCCNCYSMLGWIPIGPTFYPCKRLCPDMLSDQEGIYLFSILYLVRFERGYRIDVIERAELLGVLG